MSGISLAIAVPLNLSTVFRALRPHLFLLAVFGAFVMWNGGVVLGEFLDRRRQRPGLQSHVQPLQASMT